MKLKASVLSLLLISVSLLSCCTPLVIDQESTDAFAAGDFTLASSCIATPGKTFGMASGVDSCHFTVGDQIGSATWTLVVPPPSTAQQVTALEIDVYVPKYSLHKTYSAANDWALEIPFSDLFGTTWTADQDEAVVEALATITYVDNEKVNHVLKTRAIAFMVITAAGYDRMQVDSGNQAWGVTCKVQISTAGRSAVECK